MIKHGIFKQYADYSVKVDRYFHCVNAYANNYNGLKEIHDTLDGTYKRMLQLEKTEMDIDNDIKDFLHMSYFTMQRVYMTNVFSDKDLCVSNMVYVQLFSYITCYCYQWNLFEAFISYIVDKLIKSKN